MTRRHEAILVSHGALAFPRGMMAGFPFAFEIPQRVDAWPAPGSIAADTPGDVRGWRMALSAAQAGWGVGGLLVTAWGSIVASWIAPRALLGNRISPVDAAGPEGPPPMRQSLFLTVSDGPSSVWNPSS